MKRKLKPKVKIFLIILVMLIVGITTLLLLRLGDQPKIDINIKENIKDIDSGSELELQAEKIEEVNILKKENSDTYGYLSIVDTDISYPVMYTKGEDYYLRKDFNKKYSIAGSLFINKNNNIVNRDDNIIIYGHNMDDESMFGTLDNYLEEDYYNTHKDIILVTTEYEEYKIVSVFLSKVFNVSDTDFKYYKYFNFENEEDFNYYKDNIEELSKYHDLDSLEYGDKIITLSTCNDYIENGRLVVIAKRVN